MLNDCEASAMIAVKDLQVAAAFYEGKLGLSRLSTEGEEAITYRSGNSRLNVYRSQYAGTNKATAAVWNVGPDIDAIASHLASRGIEFEQYDMPDMVFDRGIHRGAGMDVAWFKDPDGNILNIVSE